MNVLQSILSRKRRTEPVTLRVMLVSDQESEYLWDYFDRTALEGVELIISCGDLKPEYLSFLVTMLPVPLYYVRGNHDKCYDTTPPDGCVDLEEEGVVVFRGVRFAGFGGCKAGFEKPLHYSEDTMRKHIRKRANKFALHGSFDVLVTAARGLGDAEDTFHQGFECFRELLDKYHPSYHFHGHQHLSYNFRAQRTHQYGDTTIINGFNYHIVDITVPALAQMQNRK